MILRLRIHLHDFSGHAFPVELARDLARRGHAVHHAYSSQYVTGHGRLAVMSDDPDSLRITPITTSVPLAKYDPIGRLRFERAYAREWRAFLDRHDFDVVVSCNVPLFSLALMQRYLARRRLPWMFWHQDIYSRGITSELGRRLPFGAAALGTVVERLEARQVRNATSVVAIADGFLRQYERWGLHTGHVSVVPNWAAAAPPGERDNAWAREHELPAEGLRILYAGTLGRKHNPYLLLRLLDGVRAHGVPATLIVCSEGVGADDLRAAAGERADVQILDFQPVERFPEVLAAADVHVALLEPDAAEFSVPSKVATYLASGRPVLGFIPETNPAAEDIRATGGLTVPPRVDSVAAAARWVAALPRADGSPAPVARPRDTDAIVDTFEAILTGAAATSSRPSG